jgi:hypothetical protein
MVLCINKYNIFNAKGRGGKRRVTQRRGREREEEEERKRRGRGEEEREEREEERRRELYHNIFSPCSLLPAPFPLFSCL